MGGLIIQGGEQCGCAPEKPGPERTEHQVSKEDLEGMSLGKPGWVNSGMTDDQKITPGMRIPLPLLFFKIQALLINVKSSKKGPPRCGILYMFDPGSMSSVDLEYSTCGVTIALLAS